MEILPTEEAAEWLRLDDNAPELEGLIQAAHDIAEGSIDGFEDKLKSARFRRQLKLFMLNCVVNLYDRRELTGDLEDRLQYTSATLMRQMQHGEYAEGDT